MTTTNRRTSAAALLVAIHASSALGQTTTYWYPQNQQNASQSGPPNASTRPPGAAGQPWMPSSGAGNAFDLEKGKRLFIGVPNTQRPGKKYVDFRIAGTGVSLPNGKPAFTLPSRPGYGYYYDAQGNHSGQQAGSRDWYAPSGTTAWIGSVSFVGKDGCPAWEWIGLENRRSGAGGGPASYSGITITATSKCEHATAADRTITGDATFGCGQEDDPMAITEIVDFPVDAVIDPDAPPTFEAPPGTGPWQMQIVDEAPDGTPRPGGGVRWWTNGPGLRAGDDYAFAYTMLGDAVPLHDEFAYDAASGEWRFYRRDLRPQAIEWRTMRHSTSSSLGLVLDPVAALDATVHDDGRIDPVASRVPTPEPRLGGVRRIEVDFDVPVVLVDPGAVVVRDLGGMVPVQLVELDPAGTTLGIVLPEGAIVDASVIHVDVFGAIDDLAGDPDCHVTVLRGDVTGDGRVDEVDVAAVMAHLGEPTVPETAHLDLDLDGAVTGADVLIVEDAVGASVLCPGSVPLVPWQDGFEGYAVGVPLHGDCGWRGWDADPAFAAPVTDASARAGAQSIEIGGAADLVNEIHWDDADPASWYAFRAWQYIPSDFVSGGDGPFDGSWFVLLNTYADGGPYHWSVQMQADSNDGRMKCFVGNGLDTADVPYVVDQWVPIDVVVDLENDWTRVYYDDQLMTEYSWTGGVLGDGGGALDLAAVDLFANGSSSVFYDDLRLEPVTGCGTSLADDADGDGLSLAEEFVRGTDSCEQDTDGDGVPDGVDLCPLTFDPEQGDADGDGIGDACDPVHDCPADVSGDGTVGFDDLVAVLAAWGACPGCPQDADGDGVVGFGDVLAVLSGWGDCG